MKWVSFWLTFLRFIAWIFIKTPTWTSKIFRSPRTFHMSGNKKPFVEFPNDLQYKYNYELHFLFPWHDIDVRHLSSNEHWALYPSIFYIFCHMYTYHKKSVPSLRTKTGINEHGVFVFYIMRYFNYFYLIALWFICSLFNHGFLMYFYGCVVGTLEKPFLRVIFLWGNPHFKGYINVNHN